MGQAAAPSPKATPQGPVRCFAAVAPPSSEPGSAIAVAIFDSLANESHVPHCSGRMRQARGQDGRGAGVSEGGWHSMVGQGKTGQDRAGQAVALYRAHHQHQHQHHTDDDDDEHQGPLPPPPARASRASQQGGQGPRRSVGCGAVALRAAGWVVCSEEVKIRMEWETRGLAGHSLSSHAKPSRTRAARLPSGGRGEERETACPEHLSGGGTKGTTTGGSRSFRFPPRFLGMRRRRY